MTRNDKTITCKDCGKTFIFRYDEQNFFAERGYDEPTRCKDCRAARKADAANRQDKPRAGGGREAGRRAADKELFPAVCAACGKSTLVPFKPRAGGKPVYCGDCYAKKR